MTDISAAIALTLGIDKKQVDNVLQLLSEGATIPFISRYRKEKTGGLDEVQLLEIKQQHEKWQELIARKETILKSIEEQGKLTDELKQRIEVCNNLSELEDIYLPYKPKRRTRATIAKEKGLEPLAAILMKQGFIDVEQRAEAFLNSEVESVEDALAGARDIIAEWVSENARARNITSCGKKKKPPESGGLFIISTFSTVSGQFTSAQRRAHLSISAA